MQGAGGEEAGGKRSNNSARDIGAMVNWVQMQREITSEISLLWTPLLCKAGEQEETLLLSAQECSSMADTSKFRTPRRNHLKPIAVPEETYITEFENGYQDTAEGEYIVKEWQLC